MLTHGGRILKVSASRSKVEDYLIVANLFAMNKSEGAICPAGTFT